MWAEKSELEVWARCKVRYALMTSPGLKGLPFGERGCGTSRSRVLSAVLLGASGGKVCSSLHRGTGSVQGVSSVGCESLISARSMIYRSSPQTNYISQQLHTKLI